jgi:hypothetical protein
MRLGNKDRGPSEASFGLFLMSKGAFEGLFFRKEPTIPQENNFSDQKIRKAAWRAMVLPQ